LNSARGIALSIGIGLGVALYSGSDWWWHGLIGIILITVIHIVIKSELYRDYIEKCNVAGSETSIKYFALFDMLTNAIVALIAFGILRLIMFVV